MHLIHEEKRLQQEVRTWSAGTSAAPPSGGTDTALVISAAPAHAKKNPLSMLSLQGALLQERTRQHEDTEDVPVPQAVHFLFGRPTFSCLTERQRRRNRHLPLLPGAHVHHADVQASDDLSHAQDEPLRVSLLVRPARTETVNMLPSPDGPEPEPDSCFSSLSFSAQISGGLQNFHLD